MWAIEGSLLSKSNRIQRIQCFIYGHENIILFFSIEKDLFLFVFWTSMKTHRKHDEKFHRWKVFLGEVQDSDWYKQVVIWAGVKPGDPCLGVHRSYSFLFYMLWQSILLTFKCVKYLLSMWLQSKIAAGSFSGCFSFLY